MVGRTLLFDNDASLELGRSATLAVVDGGGVRGLWPLVNGAEI